MSFFKSKESLGIFFAILAYFNFSILDAFQKTAVIYHSIFQILLIKYSFVLFLSYFESRRKNTYKLADHKIECNKLTKSNIVEKIIALYEKY